jgi:transposase-like protein
MTPAQSDHRNKMLTLAREWRESGAPARLFAQEHGVTTWTLYYWRQRVIRDERTARRRRRPKRVRLAPVHVVAGATTDPGRDLEIVLASGDRVRVSAAVSVEALRRVVEVLRTGC